MPHQPSGQPWPRSGEISAAMAGEENAPLSAYVHVPFCTVRCGYCDFNTYTTGFGAGADLATYADSVLQEIALSESVIGKSAMGARPLESVFFGGGTPSLLAVESVGDILHALVGAFGLAPGAEITLEANPETLDMGKARALADMGVTRFSIGMQSAVGQVLRTLDRTHDRQSVPRAVNAAKNAGCQVSVDLIYGAPGETLSQWRASLEAAIALEPDHISAYSLIIEDGTKMGRDLAAGLIPAPDPDEEAAKYELADALLSRAGYQWYEISNFSTSPQTRSVHNLAYWRDWDWWGYGPGAHSHIRNQRWWNVKHPRAYAARIAAGESPAVAGENLSSEDRHVEAVMLAIRTREGIPLAEKGTADGETLSVDHPAVERLVDSGLAQVSRNGREGAVPTPPHLVLTIRGRLLADQVTRILLGWE